MNIIYLDWNAYGSNDAYMALKNLGHSVTTLRINQEFDSKAQELEQFIKNLTSLIQETHCEMVFSLNYFPAASDICLKHNCIYLSWIYDNPHIRVYHKSISNPCNHVYSFDTHMVTSLQNQGIDTIHYAPMAANVSRLTAIAPSAEQQQQYTCDISFIGSLYKENKNNFYDKLMNEAKNDAFLKGYLEGLINTQKLVYGYNYLPECLNNPMILDKLRTYSAFPPLDNYYISESEVYADYYLTRQLAFAERVDTLMTLGEFFDVNFYTFVPVQLGKVKVHQSIDYLTEMPCLFQSSKINLNISLRSIRNGIPLRAIDILGSGGFLLTNFQEDFLLHFEEGKHFDSYSSIEEACEKCTFYLAHDNLRQQIANNAKEIMLKEHTYEIRLHQMIKEATR